MQKMILAGIVMPAGEEVPEDYYDELPHPAPPTHEFSDAQVANMTEADVAKLISEAIDAELPARVGVWLLRPLSRPEDAGA